MYGIDLVILQLQDPETPQEVEGRLRHGPESVVADVQLLDVPQRVENLGWDVANGGSQTVRHCQRFQ